MGSAIEVALARLPLSSLFPEAQPRLSLLPCPVHFRILCLVRRATEGRPFPLSLAVGELLARILRLEWTRAYIWRVRLMVWQQS